MKYFIRGTKYILSLLPLLCLFVSCRDRGCDTKDFNDIGQQISDSINAGSMAGALRIALSEKQRGAESRDSNKFYNGMAHQAVVSYYSGRPEDLKRQVDSIDRYLDSRPETQARRDIRGRTCSLKAGYYTRFHFNPDSNIYYYTKALEYIQDSDDPGHLVNAYCNLAGAYRNNGNYDLGAEYFSRAAHIADSADLQPSFKILSSLGLAATYTDMRDFDQSHIWWTRAGKLWDNMSVDDRFHYLNNLGHDLYLQHRYNESLQMFSRLDSLLRANPSLEWESYFCRANMTDVLLKLNRPDNAEELINQTEKYFTEVQPNEYIQEHIRTQKLQLSTLRGQYDKVSRMLDEWNRTGIESRPEQKTERLEFLKDFYADTGQWEKAFMAQKEYNEYEDSIRSEAQRLSMSERQMRYERDARIIKLCKDIEMHRKLHTRNLMIGIIAVIVIVLLVIVLVLMRRMSRDREERMLNRIIALRLESLRARINPHFIYNVLNHEIAARQSGQPPRLDTIVSLLRRQQYMADTLAVSLREDLAFIDDYVKVECEGYDFPLKFITEIAPDIDTGSQLVPSMLLQIFVENAFKHGFSSLPHDVEHILIIRAFRINGEIRLEVLNNASPDAAPSPDSTRQGLKIVMGTLEILNEKKRDTIRCDIGEWTDNPQHAGYRAAIIIPANFNFNIHGKN